MLVVVLAACLASYLALVATAPSGNGKALPFCFFCVFFSWFLLLLLSFHGGVVANGPIGYLSRCFSRLCIGLHGLHQCYHRRQGQALSRGDIIPKYLPRASLHV